MASILRLSHFLPSATGNGGNHRSYQIQYDCGMVVGADNVALINMRDRYGLRMNLMDELKMKIRRRLIRYLGGTMPPARGHSHFDPARLDFVKLVDDYEHVVAKLSKPIVAIIDHPDFSHILDLNREREIVTVACSQNLESFDSMLPLEDSDRESWLRAGHKLGVELYALSKCHERLFISKVETGLANGLGLRSKYYPYVPVGEISEQMKAIRRARALGGVQPSTFLLLGSAVHAPTGIGFRWFVENAIREGLPRGVRVIAVGEGTDKLLRLSETMPESLELRGFVSQNELDALMKMVGAVLAPQFSGFGSLTRLAELCYADIPVLISEQSTYATDLPRRAQVVKADWKAWCDAMTRPLDRTEFGISDKTEPCMAPQKSSLVEVLEGLVYH